MSDRQELLAGDPLEDLYLDAQLHQKAKKASKAADPSMRHALDAASKKMRELYTLPENWERTRGIALIDRATQILIGNFSEYKHRTIPNTRKLLREHAPIAISASEYVDGYLGVALEQRLRGNTWESEHQVRVPVLLDEMMVEAPEVTLVVRTRLGVVVRADLLQQTQFASASGQIIISLPGGTDIWMAAGADTKAAVRRQLG